MTKPSINLNQMLYNLDIGSKEWYESLDSEYKKSFSPYVAMRFASSVKSNKILQEAYIESVNEFCNKHFTTTQKHNDDSLLFWKLLCLCGAGQKQFHPWIKPMKRVPNKSLKKLQQIYPTWKETDLETLDKVITDRELEELIEAHGINE